MRLTPSASAFEAADGVCENSLNNCTHNLQGKGILCSLLSIHTSLSLLPRSRIDTHNPFTRPAPRVSYFVFCERRRSELCSGTGCCRSNPAALICA